MPEHGESIIKGSIHLMRRIRRRVRRPRSRVSSQRPETAPKTRKIVIAPATTIAMATSGELAIKAPPSPKPGISVALVGPAEWRAPLVRWLEYEPDMAISAEIDLVNRPPHVFDLPTSDVVIAFADTGDPEPAVEMTLESSGRGIPWVDPIIIRLLQSFEDGTADFDEEYADSHISEFVGNNTHSADADDAPIV